MAHNIKPGVATGDQVQEIFNYAKQKGFALPAVNVIGSDTINGVLETAAKLNAPVIQGSYIPTPGRGILYSDSPVTIQYRGQTCVTRNVWQEACWPCRNTKASSRTRNRIGFEGAGPWSRTCTQRRC